MDIINKNGPVIIIEDDEDDKFILQDLFNKLGYNNEIIFFSSGHEALDYLNQPNSIPFLIISDINMPKLSGFDLREKLKTDAALNLKCIPYLFFTTAVNQKAVIEAYSASVQGFFVKRNSMQDTEKTIRTIMEYWRLCAAPNDFDEKSAQT
jgi:CheY-like chemotaxis protein